MPHRASKTGRQRRRRAKATVDFATGEVHDRLIDAGGHEDTGTRAIAQAQGTAHRDRAPDALLPEAFSPEELSNEDRAQLGADTAARRARATSPASRLRWAKARKIP